MTSACRQHLTEPKGGGFPAARVGHSLAPGATGLQLALAIVAVQGDVEASHAGRDAVRFLVLVLQCEVGSVVLSQFPAFLCEDEE